MLKDYYDWDRISWIPIKDLFERFEFFRPKFQEIARRQSQERLEAELMQKRMNRPSNKPYR